jgi:hypothetical protein
MKRTCLQGITNTIEIQTHEFQSTIKKQIIKRVKTTYLIWIVLILFLSSCIIDYTTMTEFVIENNSNQKVKVKVQNFETVFYSSVDTVFSIDVNSKISFQYEEDGEDSKYQFPFGISSDSIMIFFNDSISTFYTKDYSSQRNPLQIENYSGDKVKEGLYRYIYEFTNQDYREAIKQSGISTNPVSFP